MFRQETQLFGTFVIFLTTAVLTRPGEAADTPIQPGDKVVVTAAAPIKVGDQTLAMVPGETEFTAGTVNGQWVAFTAEANGEKTNGWIDVRHLVRMLPQVDIPFDAKDIESDVEQAIAKGNAMHTLGMGFESGVLAMNSIDGHPIIGMLAAKQPSGTESKAVEFLLFKYGSNGKEKVFSTFLSASGQLILNRNTEAANGEIGKIEYDDLDAATYLYRLPHVAAMQRVDQDGEVVAWDAKEPRKLYLAVSVYRTHVGDVVWETTVSVEAITAYDGKAYEGHRTVHTDTHHPQHQIDKDVMAVPRRNTHFAVGARRVVGRNGQSETGGADRGVTFAKPFYGTWEEEEGNSQLVIAGNSITWNRKAEGTAAFPLKECQIEDGGREIAFNATETAYMDFSTGKAVMRAINVTLSLNAGKLTLSISPTQTSVSGRDGLVVQSPVRYFVY